MGVYSSMLTRFRSHVTNKQKCVTLNTSNFTSRSLEFRGAYNWKPLLFILFINDISFYFVYVKFVMHADNLKIYSAITSLTYCYTLKTDLNRFRTYLKKNYMTLNLSNSSYITFTRNRSNNHV